MARPRARSQAPVIPTNSLVASAIRFNKKSARIYQGSQGWQAECYRHYAICGEARFAARFFGHALSRARLGVARPTDSGQPEAVTEGKAVDLLKELFNGQNGQAQMLEAVGIHLTIAGECYLVGRTVTGEEGTSAEVWEIVSTQEIHVTGTRWSIRYSDAQPDIVLTDDDVVIRIWSPNPAKRIEADSPFRSLLPILSEIEWLTRNIFAQTSSRLAGAGLLLLPQNMSFPPPPSTGEKAAETANEADSFMLSLADAMMTPISNPESPSAMVPIVVTAPAEAISAAKLMHFWSDLDAEALNMRTEAIRRFALGMDLPPEQVLGMSSNSGTGGGTSNGVSHWGAWQIEEATIKMHVEPMLELVTNALTVSYIRPLAETDEIITSDTSALRLRPDRSQESIELHDRGLLKASVMLRENGFDPEVDAMDDDELKTWLLRKVASGSATPEQVGAALRALGVELGVSVDSAEVPNEARPDPSLEDHPTRPRTPSEAVLAASEGLVFRALEKAGNRWLNAGKRGKDRDRSITPHMAHVHERINGEGPELLRDAFTCAPQVLAGHADPDVVVPALNAYCLSLFETQQPHTRERLREALGEML